jgi:hypothetical protein
MSKEIEDLLDRHYDIDFQIICLRDDRNQEVNRLLEKAGLLVEIESIDLETEGRIRQALANKAGLEEEIRGRGLVHMATVTGTHEMAVYNTPHIKWDTDKLIKLANEYPEILDHAQVGQPWVTIRRKRGGT